MEDSSSSPSSSPSKNETLRGSPPAPPPDTEEKTSPSSKSKSKGSPLSPPPPLNSPSSQESISPISQEASASSPPQKNAIAPPPTQEEEDSNASLPPPPPPPSPLPKSSTSPPPPFSSVPPLPAPSTPPPPPPPPSPPPPPPSDDDEYDEADDGSVVIVDKSRSPPSKSTSPKKRFSPPPPPTTTPMLPPIAPPMLPVPPPPPQQQQQTASNFPITQQPSPLSPPSPTQVMPSAARWASSSQNASSTTPPDATSSTRSTTPRPHASTPSDTASPRQWVSTPSDTASSAKHSTSSDSRQAEDSEHLNHPPKKTGSFSPTPPSTESSSSNAKYKDQNTNLYIGLGVTGLAILLIIIAVVVLRKKRSKTDAVGGHYRPPGGLALRSVDGCYYDHGNAGGFSDSGGPYFVKKPSSAHPPGPVYSNGYAPGPPDPTGARCWFAYEELMEITDGFSRENVIGEGGFGWVYKGCLLDGRRVAVKQLKADSGQGDREFRAEVEIISRVHHRHLVSLVGYCIAEYHRLLVYEFVPNNTLEHHLHGKELPVMDWTKRMRIANGSARGLAYLHEDCHPRIIHRDIKSANILLDEYFEAQVADFGLAKLSDDTNTHVSTRVMGTFGYMAPEYASSGKLTDRSDVFSFGVVLLEIITGRKPVDPSQPLGDESLVEWARPHLVHALETGNIDELVDPRLENNFSRGEMIRMIEVAAACVRHYAPKRPRMVQVVRALDNDGELADLTNGVKLGQSTVYDSTQYSADIQKFRMMAYGSGMYSSEDGSSREFESRSAEFSGESTESVNRPLNPQRPGQIVSGQYMHQGRGFN